MNWMHGLTIVVAIATTACGSSRPTGSSDQLDCRLDRFVVDDVFADIQAYAAKQSTTGNFVMTSDAHVNVLALSAGGELGVFGAGFLRGWQSVGESARPVSRNRIHVVTGVSAGALLATHAYLGDDRFLYEVLPSIGFRDLFASRSLSLIWSNSILDDSGKNENQAKVVLTDEVIDAVARSDQGRFLYIGVVDVDSGRFLQIDMLRLAREVSPVGLRNACYRAVVGASTAIPVLMGPKFVDGMMLVDGAVRHHLFTPFRPENAWTDGVRGRLFVVVNQDISKVETVACEDRVGKTCNGLLPIAKRVATLATDQALKDSLRSVESLARQVPPGGPGRYLDTFYVTATTGVNACIKSKAECETSTAGNSGGYCSSYMKCIAAAGLAAGQATASDQSPWKSFNDLGIGHP
jgi:predicted acylesterase/phospholipase RssA